VAGLLAAAAFAVPAQPASAACPDGGYPGPGSAIELSFALLAKTSSGAYYFMARQHPDRALDSVGRRL
jgi:hypothetical protein